MALLKSTPERLFSDDMTALHIQRAEAAIAGLKAQFAEWVRADLASIDVHFRAAAEASSPAICGQHLEELRRIAHNIKGQGGTFGCNGLSAAAAELDALLKRRQEASVLQQVHQLIARLNAAYDTETA
jgi:HPt (histidine-containing phosphotransfer) domain-containing protein